MEECEQDDVQRVEPGLELGLGLGLGLGFGFGFGLGFEFGLDVERVALVVEAEGDDGEEDHHLHGDRDAVDDVRAQALEDAARGHDRGEDGREAGAGQHDVRRRLG